MDEFTNSDEKNGLSVKLSRGENVHDRDGCETGRGGLRGLRDRSPEPWRSWLHPTSNLSPSGEKNNGDNFVMIEAPRIATSYAIEALRVFDHLHFRSRMQESQKSKGSKSEKKESLTLQKPSAISGKPAWFEEYCQDNTQKENDRQLFSH